MSKKRTSFESNKDEQTQNNSDPVFRENDDFKRAKLTSLSNTTLQDLPLELVECILVRAVAMEVEEMHLVKSVWKKKAELVISRLSSVCPDWSNILTTNFFQNELYRTLDRTVEKTIRLEILHQSPLQNVVDVTAAIALKDELFVHTKSTDCENHFVNVYDRNNVTKVKDVIPLPGISLVGMTACSVSNCLYILNRITVHGAIVLRIVKEAEHQFTVSSLISGGWMPGELSISDNGDLILWKRFHSKPSTRIIRYDAKGSLQHELYLTSDLYLFNTLIPKLNGNYVLVSTKDIYKHDYRTQLTEIDTNGTMLRQCQTSECAFRSACLADRNGGIVIVEWSGGIQLLDNEFNLLNVIIPQLDLNDSYFICSLCYNRERNDIVIVWEQRHWLEWTNPCLEENDSGCEEYDSGWTETDSGWEWSDFGCGQDDLCWYKKYTDWKESHFVLSIVRLSEE